MMGVNYDLFWTLNPKSLIPFVKAFDLKRKYDDSVAWTNGVYIQMAIASCFNKTQKYPKRPFLTEKPVEQSVMSADEIKERMFAQMNKINKRFRKENTE